MDVLEGSRVLVSGASGYIGTNLAERVTSRNLTLVRLTRDASKLPDLDGAARTVDVAGDIRERELWLKALQGVDVVIHLAAQTSVPAAEEDPRGDWEVNVLPMLNLLETCRIESLNPTVLLAGTTTECGIPRRLPVDEDHPDDPVTIYDLHKLTAERYLKHYVTNDVVRGTCLRLGNVYGPGPRSSSADRGILNSMVRRALEGETLTVYGEGDHVRDYIYIQDVVEAFLASAAYPQKVGGRHFVVGTGEGVTVAEAFRTVAERVEELTGREVPVEHVDPPEDLHPIDERDFVADPSALREATGWTTSVGLVEGIDRTIATFQETSHG